ncbi:MAG: VWA domain-containing protein [Betaproteobacteria bacterium]
MLRPRVRATLPFVIAALVWTAAPAFAQAQHRSLYVTVVDADGQPVTNLGPSDFVVREDNVQREVLTVAPADAPMQVALLVDNSTAARNDIQNIRKGLEDFVGALAAPTDTGRRNEIALLTLGDRPTLQADYTIDRAEIQKGIGRVFAQPGSGNYLLDAIVEAVHGIEKRTAERPVIVAITTEGPEFSSRQYDAVLDPLRQSGAAFYALVIGPPSGEMTTSARNRGIVLDQGPRDTGGRRETLLSSMALDGALKTLAAQLTHALLVTYSRPESLIPPERITVDVKRPGLSAHGTPVKSRSGGNPEP